MSYASPHHLAFLYLRTPGILSLIIRWVIGSIGSCIPRIGQYERLPFCNYAKCMLTTGWGIDRRISEFICRESYCIVPDILPTGRINWRFCLMYVVRIDKKLITAGIGCAVDVPIVSWLNGLWRWDDRIRANYVGDGSHLLNNDCFIQSPYYIVLNE